MVLKSSHFFLGLKRRFRFAIDIGKSPSEPLPGGPFRACATENKAWEASLPGSCLVPTGQCYGRMGAVQFDGEYGDLVKRNDFECYHYKYCFKYIYIYIYTHRLKKFFVLGHQLESQSTVKPW